MSPGDASYEGGGASAVTGRGELGRVSLPVRGRSERVAGLELEETGAEAIDVDIDGVCMRLAPMVLYVLVGDEKACTLGLPVAPGLLGPVVVMIG
jgi:hypothetical protein